MLLVALPQVLWQIANRAKQPIRPCSADAGRGGEGAENTDRAYTCAPRHFDVFGRVADIHGVFRLSAQSFERELKRCRMRLPSRDIFTVHAGGEMSSELKVAQLSADAPGAPTRYDPKFEGAPELANDPSRPGQQHGSLRAVGQPPQSIGARPSRRGNSCRAIYLVPVWTVGALELFDSPLDFERTKHCEVGANVRCIGIEQRAIPIKQYDARW